MFNRLRFWLSVKKPFQIVAVPVEERKRRVEVVKEGMKSEFWKIMSEELKCSLQNERNFAARQMVLGNDKVAKQSAMLAEAVLKVLNAPSLVMQSNQDILPEIEEGIKSNKKPVKDTSSRFMEDYLKGE